MEIAFPPFFSMILIAFFVRCAEASFKESCVYFLNIIKDRHRIISIPKPQFPDMVFRYVSSIYFQSH